MFSVIKRLFISSFKLHIEASYVKFHLSASAWWDLHLPPLRELLAVGAAALHGDVERVCAGAPRYDHAIRAEGPQNPRAYHWYAGYKQSMFKCIGDKSDSSISDA